MSLAAPQAAGARFVRRVDSETVIVFKVKTDREGPVTLEQFASIGEIIGGIGVVVSLVYLAIQIRSNTEAERTSTYQSIVSDFGALNNSMASSPELSYMFAQGMEDYHQLKPDEQARVSQMFFQCFHYFENMFYQYRKGYLDEEVWAGWRRLMLTYHSRPGFQTWWKYRRDVYSEPFAHFLETEKPDRKIPTYYEISNLKSVSSSTDDE